MATWEEFEKAAPDLAAAGLRLFGRYCIAFLATARKDGSPRVNPVCPIIAGGHLSVVTWPTAPKRYDLRRDNRYMLHALPGDEDEEFSIRGRSREANDPETRAAVIVAAAAGVMPSGVRDDDIIITLEIEQADHATWENWQQPNTRAIRKRWRQRA